MANTREQAYTTSRPDVFRLVPPSAIRILDAGCSNGELGAALRSAHPRRTVVGIEADSDFCEQAKLRLDDAVHADLNTFDWARTFPPESFDCLIFADVLEHLIDPWNCLRSACACLRPGGTVVVSLPNIRHISALFSIYLKGRFPRSTRGIFDGTHLRWFTLADAAALVQEAGLQVTKRDFSLRIRDQGGGMANKIAEKVFGPIRQSYVVREFLTYQVCLQAAKPIPPFGATPAGCVQQASE